MLEKAGGQLSCGGWFRQLQLPENFLNCQARTFFMDTVTEQLWERGDWERTNQGDLASLVSSIFWKAQSLIPFERRGGLPVFV
jgi:hypothetical protein